MANAQHQSYPYGDDILFGDRITALDEAEAALCRVKNTPHSHAEDAKHLTGALGHFLAAHKAQPSQTIINDISRNAGYLGRTPQHRFIMADYYLAVAEFSVEPKQVMSSLEAAMGAAHKAVRAGQDQGRVAEIALNVLGLCPVTDDGHLITGEASAFISRHVNMLTGNDVKNGTSTARAFLETQLIKLTISGGDRNGLARANIQGHYRHVTVAQTSGIAAANDDKPNNRHSLN